ncbi:MAG: hypothetical protein R2784_17530 [Saprospiraceae bacterium]
MWNADFRTSQMKKLAFDLELEFVGEEEWGLINRLQDFKLFNQGIKKSIFNMMHKKTDFFEEQVYLFDYKYVISTGKATQKFYTSVFFIQSKELGLPEFLMKPENFFHKIGSFLGMQDIDFEESPEFSNQYLLKSDDEYRLRKLFDEDMLKMFTVEKNWTLEGIGYFMVFYRHNYLLNMQTLESFYKKGMTIYDFLKGR